MEEKKFTNLEKDIGFLSYQEKKLYLKILNNEKEIDAIKDKLKSIDNFFLTLIDIDSMDTLTLVRLYHNIIYEQLNINDSIELRKEVYINIIKNMIDDDIFTFPFYFKYFDLDMFSINDIKKFFLEFFWNRKLVIKKLEARSQFYIKCIDFNLLKDEELEDLYIYTDLIIEDSWINPISIWSYRYSLNLPKEKSELLSIEKIIAHDIEIEYIPKEIGKLQNLQEIDFSNNNISIFDDNIIKEIPEEIYNLPNLTKLNISNNKIKNMPPGISKLTNLRELNISKNEITKIPEEISSLIELKELYMFDNGLMSISKLFSNPTVKISKKFINLKNLTILDNQDYKKSDENISDFFIRKNYQLT